MPIEEFMPVKIKFYGTPRMGFKQAGKILQ
jgi:hypothetical protein